MTAPHPESSRPSGEEVRDAVAAVLQDQAERAERREESPPPPRDRGPFVAGLFVVLLGLTVWFLLAPPAFLLPPPTPEPTPVEMEAGLRMDMWVAALHLNRYQDTRGALPGSLAEALENPEDGQDLLYERVSDQRYRLVGQRDTLVLVYESTESLEDFRRPAVAVVDGGGGSP